VVDSGDQDVFEGDHAAFFPEVEITGGGEFLEWIFVIDRHDFGAGLVRGAVEGDGEAELERFGGQLADLRGQTAGGDGDFARADLAAPRRVEDAQGAQEVVVVGQRFAHPHDHDVVNQ